MTDPFTPPAGQAFDAPQAQAPLYGEPYGGAYGPPAKKNGFGVTALVLGIVSLLLCIVPGLGLLLGVLAIVFAVLGRRRIKRREADNSAQAIAGLVMGILSSLVGAAVLVVLVFFVDEITDYSRCLTDAGGNPTLERLCQDQLTDRITGQPAG